MEKEKYIDSVFWHYNPKQDTAIFTFAMMDSVHFPVPQNKLKIKRNTLLKEVLECTKSTRAKFQKL